MSLSDLDKELLPFLSRDQRPDVKFFAMQHFLGEPGSGHSPIGELVNVLTPGGLLFYHL